MLRLPLTASLLLAGFLGNAPACQICIPFPKKSAADFLLEAETIVLAREDPDLPFHFSPVEVLKGTPGAGPIGLFVDSATRALLTAHPDRSVVLAGNTRDGKTAWDRIGIADSDTLPVVRSVLASTVDWKENPKERIRFFAANLGNENAELRTLAHLEVARAPYDEIRQLRDAFTREEIHQFLANMRYLEWHALYILLLARSEHPDDPAFIRESFRAAARFHTTNRLAAWATAAIEIDEAAAIDFIETDYFRNPGRTPEELQAVLQALSVHGTGGHTHLRDRIVTSYASLLAGHPALTATVANDLIKWKRTELTEEIAAYAAANSRSLDFDTTLQLRKYARQAQK